MQIRWCDDDAASSLTWRLFLGELHNSLSLLHLHYSNSWYTKSVIIVSLRSLFFNIVLNDEVQLVTLLTTHDVAIIKQFHVYWRREVASFRCLFNEVFPRSVFLFVQEILNTRLSYTMWKKNILIHRADFHGKINVELTKLFQYWPSFLKHRR